MSHSRLRIVRAVLLEWLAAHSPVITPLLPVRLRRPGPSAPHALRTPPGRLHPAPPRGEYLQSKQKKTETQGSAQHAYTVNDPTCFRCRVGRFSEFEFRLPESGPMVHPSRELMDSGPKRREKLYEMKAGYFAIDICKRSYYDQLLLFLGLVYFCFVKLMRTEL